LSDTTRVLSGGPAAAADPLAVRANKLDLLERLSDSLAHEIKNPLHSMVINLEVLRRRLERGEGTRELTRYTEVLGEELERVSRRIELLLRLARPERGGVEETTLQELVEELAELVTLDGRHRDVAVEYRTSGEMARVRVARQAARQLLLDLVLDALDGADPGDRIVIDVRGVEGGARVSVEGGGAPDPERTAVAVALASAAGGGVEVSHGVRTLVLPRVGRD
jgi:signal transduction histidine kinase